MKPEDTTDPSDVVPDILVCLREKVILQDELLRQKTIALGLIDLAKVLQTMMPLLREQVVAIFAKPAARWLTDAEA